MGIFSISHTLKLQDIHISQIFQSAVSSTQIETLPTHPYWLEAIVTIGSIAIGGIITLITAFYLFEQKTIRESHGILVDLTSEYIAAMENLGQMNRVYIYTVINESLKHKDFNYKRTEIEKNKCDDQYSIVAALFYKCRARSQDQEYLRLLRRMSKWQAKMKFPQAKKIRGKNHAAIIFSRRIKHIFVQRTLAAEMASYLADRTEQLNSPWYKKMHQIMHPQA
tara:strand:- start:1891 stop:2559 length:669 start_codon:yes stop_codon:yes gene_type:complete